MFVTIVYLSLTTASISFTISNAKIFASLRLWVTRKSKWFGSLISCSYCVSHWAATGLVAVYQPQVVSKWLPVDLVVSVFAVVCLSALVIGVLSKMFPTKRDIPAIEPPLPPPPFSRVPQSAIENWGGQSPPF